MEGRIGGTRVNLRSDTSQGKSEYRLEKSFYVLFFASSFVWLLSQQLMDPLPQKSTISILVSGARALSNVRAE